MINLNERDYSFTLKESHTTHWRQNPHARFTITLELAINHYHQLKKTSFEDATNFIKKFISKTIAIEKYSSSLKDRLAYPELLKNFS